MAHFLKNKIHFKFFLGQTMRTKKTQSASGLHNKSSLVSDTLLLSQRTNFSNFMETVQMNGAKNTTKNMTKTPQKT